jgi:hypothetical protein
MLAAQVFTCGDAPLVPGVGLNDLQLSESQRIKIFARSGLGFRAREDSYVSGTLGVSIFHYIRAALGGKYS